MCCSCIETLSFEFNNKDDMRWEFHRKFEFEFIKYKCIIISTFYFFWFMLLYKHTGWLFYIVLLMGFNTEILLIGIVEVETCGYVWGAIQGWSSNSPWFHDWHGYSTLETLYIPLPAVWHGSRPGPIVWHCGVIPVNFHGCCWCLMKRHHFIQNSY